MGKLLHHANTFWLLHVWERKIESFRVLDLDLLRLDLSDCRCQSGCRRLGKDLLENLAFDDTAASCPRRLESIGALEEEEDLWRAAVGESSDVR